MTVYIMVSPRLAGTIFNTRKVEECAVVVEYSPSRFAGILFPTRIVGEGVVGSDRRQNDLCSSGIISLIYKTMSLRSVVRFGNYSYFCSAIA